MAISAFIPQIWDARWRRHLDQSLVWGNLANRVYEGQITQAGDTVKVPVFTKTFTIRDYTESTDIAAPEEADGTTIDVVVDKQKYFNFYVDDIHEVQSTPQLMDQSMARASYQMSLHIDSDVRTTFEGAFNSSRNTEAAGNLDGTAAIGGTLLSAFAKTKRLMSVANIPMEGRWAVIHPDHEFVLDTYFLTKSADGVYVPAASDQVLRNGFKGNLLGFNLYVTTNAYETTATHEGANNTAVHRIVCGQGTYQAAYIGQFTEMIPYIPERRFGDAVKGLYVYGSKIIEGDSLHFIQTKKAA